MDNFNQGNLSPDECPALLAIVERKWIDKAQEEYFPSGQDLLYFSTNSNAIANAGNLSIKNVYFKLKGTTCLTFKADFIDLVTENPRILRLSGSEDELAKYYYGFRNIRPLSDMCKLSSLFRYGSHKQVRNDTPGSCIIIDPEID
jgi:hypothetical protein